MPEYKPALNSAEFARIDELMKELQKIQSKEEEIKKELRRLIYKTESSR